MKGESILFSSKYESKIDQSIREDDKIKGIFSRHCEEFFHSHIKSVVVSLDKPWGLDQEIH
jgi:hypothetical protein